CLHVFGMPASVSAVGNSEPASGIDYINAQLLYVDGGVVTIAGGWYHQGAFPFSMEYTAAFDGGTIDFSSAGRPATLFDLDGSHSPASTEGGDAYAAEIAYFVECCRTGRQPELCPPRESADAVKLMLRMLESRGRNGEKLKCAN